MTKKILIIGTGTHSKVVRETAIEVGYKDILFLKTNKKNLNEFQYENIINDMPIDYCGDYFVAIGHNYFREFFYKKFSKLNPKASLITLIHPRSYIANSAKIEEGVLVLPMSTIHTEAHISKGTLININCCVDHNSSLGEFSSLAPNTTIGGCVDIGKKSAFLLSSSCISGIKVGENAVIGAGACVHNDITSFSVCIGSPSKRIKFRSEKDKYMM